MPKLLIESVGWDLGSLHFPSFQLHAGEAVTLSMPIGARFDRDESQIFQGLTGKQKVPGLQVLASVAFVSPAVTKSGWLAKFQRQSPFDWLKQNTPLTDSEINSKLEKHGIDNRHPLRSYAGTPRFLLGLERVCTQSPEVVVFDTGGLDPLGRQQVFRTVEEYLPKGAAIYLAWPLSSNNNLHRAAPMPGSLNVSVTDRSETEPANLPLPRTG